MHEKYKYFSFSKSPIGFKPTTLFSHPSLDSANGHCQIFVGFHRRPILQPRHVDPFSVQNNRIPTGWLRSSRSSAGRIWPFPSQNGLILIDMPGSSPSSARTVGFQPIGRRNVVGSFLREWEYLEEDEFSVFKFIVFLL